LYNRPSKDFTNAAGKHEFVKAWDPMIKKIGSMTREQPDINRLEPEMRALYIQFLDSLYMKRALKNFELLLAEKSGDKFLRNDGTVNWYHEFIPLLTILEMGRRGKNNGGMNLQDLDAYGGLEVLICTHLRHDSVEDFTVPENLHKEQHDIGRVLAKNDDALMMMEEAKAHVIIGNIDLMSQKPKIDAHGSIMRDHDGKPVKEDVRTYTRRMLVSDAANPAVFMCKQGDICHNLATLFGASKFTDEKRRSRCDKVEDMYGPRYGFADNAAQKWPEFRRAINTLDSLMGFMLYPHFRYLENVDLHYKEPFDSPVGIERYIHRVLKINLPEAVNPAHIFLKRLVSSVDPDDHEKIERLQNYLDKVLLPVLEPHKDRFSYMFKPPSRAGSFPALAL
jgi:hypothetical protein